MLNYKGPLMLHGKYIWIFIEIRDEIFLFYTLSYNVK